MQFKCKKKLGMISIEIILSSALTLVALFVVLEVFNESLDRMLTNGNFKKITPENSAKTDYTSYGRKYADFTIYVK